MESLTAFVLKSSGLETSEPYPTQDAHKSHVKWGCWSHDFEKCFENLVHHVVQDLSYTVITNFHFLIEIKLHLSPALNHLENCFRKSDFSLAFCLPNQITSKCCAMHRNCTKCA